MKALRTIDDYLALAARSGSRALATACRNGGYSLPVSNGAGWDFTVTSMNGSVWKITITVDEDQRRYIVESEKVK